MKRDIELAANLLCLCNQWAVVSSCHIGEARAKLLHILANKWVGEHIDMVSDDHQISHLVLVADATGGIGDK